MALHKKFAKLIEFRNNKLFQAAELERAKALIDQLYPVKYIWEMEALIKDYSRDYIKGVFRQALQVLLSDAYG